MVLSADITSSTLIALTLTETIGVLVFIGTVVVAIVAFVRKDERDNTRLENVEKENSSLRAEMKHLIEQVDRLVGSVNQIARQRNPPRSPTKSKPSP